MNYNSELLRISHLSNLLLWQEPTNISTMEILQKLGYFQIDAIHVTARSQDLVPHSRSTVYQEEEVWELLKRRKIFEGFSHARCLISVEHFRYHYADMVERRNRISNWYSAVAKKKNWTDEILKQVEEKGEITSKDVEYPEDFPKFTGWTHAHKRILDYLLTRGYLLVSKRVKFNISYALPQTIIKGFDKITENLPDRIEQLWFHIENSLQAMGPSPIHRLLHYKHSQSQLFVKGKKISPRKYIQQWVKEGKLEILELIDQPKNPFYSLPGQENELTNLEQKESKDWNVFLLSPFDNSTWSREALLEQYNYDYKLECYTPKVKRKYGFFSLPILFGPRFVGRVDVKYDRKIKNLDFKQWTWEKKFKRNKVFTNSLCSALDRLVSFHGAQTISLGNLTQNVKNNIVKQIETNVR